MAAHDMSELLRALERHHGRQYNEQTARDIMEALRGFDPADQEAGLRSLRFARSPDQMIPGVTVIRGAVLEAEAERRRVEARRPVKMPWEEKPRSPWSAEAFRLMERASSGEIRGVGLVSAMRTLQDKYGGAWAREASRYWNDSRRYKEANELYIKMGLATPRYTGPDWHGLDPSLQEEGELIDPEEI